MPNSGARAASLHQTGNQGEVDGGDDSHRFCHSRTLFENALQNALNTIDLCLRPAHKENTLNFFFHFFHFAYTVNINILRSPNLKISHCFTKYKDKEGSYLSSSFPFVRSATYRKSFICPQWMNYFQNPRSVAFSLHHGVCPTKSMHHSEHLLTAH